MKRLFQVFLIALSSTFAAQAIAEDEEEFFGCCPNLDFLNESTETMDPATASFDSMILYQRPTCPFCRKVTDFMENNDIQISIKDTRDQSNLAELESIGGKRQVPCLVIDGEALYESNDIINFLSEVKANNS